MENLNGKLDGLNLEGFNISTAVVDKTNIGVFTVEQRHLTNAYFDTYKGYVQVEAVISLICVHTDAERRLEMVAGIKMMESIKMAQYLIDKKFTLEQLPEEMKKIRNYRAILRVVENKLKFDDKCIAKGIDPKAIEETAATTARKEEVIAEKIESQKFYIPAEIPSYRKGDLDSNKKQMLKNIIKVRNLANALINELSKTSK